MTTRDLTGLLTLKQANRAAHIKHGMCDTLWTMAFGAIQWPWLLMSLRGGSQAEKARQLARIGLPADALPHLGSWKADVGFLTNIIDAVERLRPRVTVELGAGASTLVTARAMTCHGGGQLISFDQHSEFVTRTRDWVEQEGGTVDLRHAPLGHESPDWPGSWYQLWGLPLEIDLILIDGPPWTIHPLVRGAAEVLFSRLSPGGMILLDDAARPGERIIARRWRRQWPDIRFTLLRNGTKGTLVGIKRGPEPSLPAAAAPPEHAPPC